MKALQKSWLLPTKGYIVILRKWRALCCLLFSFITMDCQIANYVNNGGFEVRTSSTASTYNGTKYWGPIDTNNYSYYLFSTSIAIGNAPYCSTGFQYPRTGNNFVLGQFYCSACSPVNAVGYLRNRLKQNLQAGKTYCAKYYVVNTNNNRVAIENYGIYFGSSSLDTITYCNTPLTYIIPQIEYTNGVITDTLNWTCVSGTFTATGNEKYMLIGNFRSSTNTNTLQLNTPLNPQTADIYIDDASCIAIDLPAYAGPDIWGIPTTTAYLGRQQDVGIDEACMWYKLPNTTNAIDTAAGITITVAATTETYMVKQDICGMIKYDTVVVHPSAVDVRQQQLNNRQIDIFPNPASTQLSIVSSIAEEELELTIKDMTGREMLQESLITHDFMSNLDLSLVKGIYLVTIKTSRNGSVTKKLIIAD